MRRFILTGAPGAGKTAILRELEAAGYAVVEEAATEVIAAAQASGEAEPWRNPSFIDAIARLQRERELRASDTLQFHDRSVVCTAALAAYLGYPISPFVAGELKRVAADRVFENRVFFVQSLGFVTPTSARRISYEEALRFEKIHEETYRGFGFELAPIEPGSVSERVKAIEAAIRQAGM